jgi:Transcription initiation factor IID, 31kD subunit
MSSSGTTPNAAATGGTGAAPAPAAATATSKATAPAAAAGGAATAGAAATSTTTTKATTTSKKKKASATKAASAAAAATTKKKPAPRKRKPPVSKANASASNQAVWSDARAASSDLAQQRALVAARRADPLWYRMEDVMPVNYHHKALPLSSPLNTFLSQQMQVVESALEKNGLTRSDLTPQALACLSEHARRYTQELLRDAQDFADTVGRPEISRADLLLASELRHDHPVAISTQLPQLNLVARQVNRKPLPPIPSHCYSGIVLPPKQNQLTARTFDIVSGTLTAQQMVRPLPQPPGSTTTTTTTAPTSSTADAAGGGNNKRKSTSSSGGGGGGSSYGASRGRQIPVKLKEMTPPSTSTTG